MEGEGEEDQGEEAGEGGPGEGQEEGAGETKAAEEEIEGSYFFRIHVIVADVRELGAVQRAIVLLFCSHVLALFSSSTSHWYRPSQPIDLLELIPSLVQRSKHR